MDCFGLQLSNTATSELKVCDVEYRCIQAAALHIQAVTQAAALCIGTRLPHSRREEFAALVRAYRLGRGAELTQEACNRMRWGLQPCEQGPATTRSASSPPTCIWLQVYVTVVAGARGRACVRACVRLGLVTAVRVLRVLRVWCAM